MVDRSVPMRVEESNQCESPISIARERSSYSKRFMKLLQDFHHFIQKLDFLGLNTKVSTDTPYTRLVWERSTALNNKNLELQLLLLRFSSWR